MKKISILIVVLILMITGCVQKPTETPSFSITLPDNALELIRMDYPRIDGSTSTYPLEIMIACKVYNIPCEWWDYSPFSPFDVMTRGIYITEESMNEYPDFVEMLFDFYHNGTHGSYMNLIEGEADIILVARQPSDDELREAEGKKVNLDTRPVAMDAFVFLLNTENNVDDLHLDTIRDIFSGKITNWDDMASASFDGVINTYQRNPNSGSQELMEKLVMQGTPMVDAPDMILEGMMGPFNAINNDPLGIGYSVYFYAEYIFPSETVKMIGVDGVKPNSETIADRSYSLATEVYVVIREGMPPDSTAVLLREWLLTGEGQEAVAESGYVPIR